MAAIILVHGGLHGAWCWERIVPLLIARGHAVDAIDLPGADRRIPAAAVTFDAYVAASVAAIERAREPVLLVGHSLGGRSISAAAERCPDRVGALAYVAALLPSLDGTIPSSDDNIVANGFFLADDGASVMLAESIARAAFYSDMSDGDAAVAFARIVPQPLAAMAGTIELTAGRWDRVPRYYIHTTHDRTIPLSLQQAMVARAPCTATYEIACGHSPFFTHPNELAAIIDTLAKSIAG